MPGIKLSFLMLCSEKEKNQGFLEYCIIIYFLS